MMLTLRLLLLTLFAYTHSCKQRYEQPQSAVRSDFSYQDMMMRRICMSGDLADESCDVNVEVRGDYLIAGGDMIVGRSEDLQASPGSESLTLRGAIATSNFSRWPGGRVPYAFAPRRLGTIDFFYEHIRGEMKRWEDLVNTKERRFIKFVEMDLESAKKEQYWLLVDEVEAGVLTAAAELGARYQSRALLDSMFAPYGNSTMHELGHVLGLTHEHQRPDRDTYIIGTTSRRTDTMLSTQTLGHRVPRGNSTSIRSCSTTPLILKRGKRHP